MAKFLSEEGLKKFNDLLQAKLISTGTSDYNDLINRPIEYLTGTEELPVYFNELDTGKYILNGKSQPYEGADITIYANNFLIEVEKTDTEVNVSFDNASINSKEYYNVLIDGSAYNHSSILYGELKQKEKIITNSRTLVSATINDNQSYQISSDPSRITISFPNEREVGFRCWLVFKTDDSLPTFTCNYDIKWHGDSVVDNIFTMNVNKSYTIEFWQDVNNFNAEVREV